LDNQGNLMGRWTACGICLATFAAATTISVGSTAPLAPSACSVDGELSPTTPNVKYDGSPSFSDDGVLFPVHVYSLYELPPWQTNTLCFRYELENAGNNLVPLAYWKLMDEYSAYDLAAHDRIKRNKKRLSLSKTAVEGPTVIEAFRSQRVPTIAWMTIEDWNASAFKKAEMSETVHYLHFERSATLDPAANKAIQDHQISDAEGTVIEPAGYFASTPPSVNDRVSAPFGALETSSLIYSARYLDTAGAHSFYYVITSIQIAPSAEAKLTAVFAPALVAAIQTTLRAIYGHWQHRILAHRSHDLSRSTTIQLIFPSNSASRYL
jgi:hypothetical protein